METHVIPNDLCKKAGIAATWGTVNQLGVYPYNHQTYNSKDAVSPYAQGTTASIYKIRQEVILFRPTLRKLVNEAMSIFINLQINSKNRKPEFKAGIETVSKQYRSITRACLMALQDEVTQVQGEEREEYQNYITIFYSIECIWHLCEILFVSEKPGNIVLPLLLDWIRFHFPRHEKNATTLLTGELLCLDSHPTYWDTVIGSLLQGRIQVVRAMLKLHQNANTNPFKLMNQVLSAMPSYNVYEGMSLTEFNLKWKHWIIDTQAKIDAKLFIGDKNLDFISRLVVGEELAWSQAQGHCEAWYELLAAWLFFTEPSVKAYELGDFAKTCLSRMGMRDNMKHLDRVLLAALQYDVLQVIKEIQIMTENGWFVAHLTDLLFHSGQLISLDKMDSSVSTRLRDSFLLDYGSILMAHNSLWQVGLNYLDYCANDGSHTIELLLSRLPLGNEYRVNKILRECDRRNLQQVSQSICKIQGMTSLQRGRLGNALMWALKSQDGNLVSFLADKILRNYCKSGEITNTDLLDNLGSCMMVSDKLIFLGKYCEFHKVYKLKRFKEAAALIVSLVDSKIIPKYFWPTLLLDALPLLECEELVLSSNDTHVLLHAIEERAQLPGLKEKIELFRIAIARNLSRALVCEGQII